MSPDGFTVWLTGPPCAGKTTLGRMLAAELARRGVAAVHLEGGQARANLGPELGFSKQDRHTANMRTAWAAGLVNQAGAACVVSAIAPLADTRRELRACLGQYVEVFLDCPLEQLVNRDQRGLYQQALGKDGGKEFTGLGSPYEPPDDPEVRCLSGQETPEESLGKILAYLELARLIPPVGEQAVKEPAPQQQSDGAYSPEEEAELTARLKDLGYL
ncbi:MAG: adenylyl-sulfate kinase [Desulfarculaceae bacterium]|nr:adenylyl-sulfate kinase [Desulfarculaceae bacterium]MCF8047225.1 adenylyl-sulfate kinase [Desulfarculaceae bacterium]MCF8064709.1 adenylyl-sulfate kinase [Desulfarculaceae bacterium]MCF8097636.1 adenylyl-sulfate kinase [Desulfarculaceae bacterium]MCF8122830.1 adenylyl-sulfate kinase [Desulfarculaceae bacterium]